MTLQGLLNAKVFFSPLLYFVYSKSKRKVDDQLLEFALLSLYYRPTVNVSRFNVARLAWSSSITKREKETKKKKKIINAKWKRHRSQKEFSVSLPNSRLVNKTKHRYETNCGRDGGSDNKMADERSAAEPCDIGSRSNVTRRGPRDLY